MHCKSLLKNTQPMTTYCLVYDCFSNTTIVSQVSRDNQDLVLHILEVCSWSKIFLPEEFDGGETEGIFCEPVWCKKSLLRDSCCSDFLLQLKVEGSWHIYIIINKFTMRFEQLAIRDGPLEKLWCGWGIFEPQEFCFVIKFLVWIFLGHGLNIFGGLIGVHEFFSFNFLLREYFFVPYIEWN